MPLIHQLLIYLLNLLVEVGRARVQLQPEVLIVVRLEVVEVFGCRHGSATALSALEAGGVHTTLIAIVRLIVLVQLVGKQVVIQIILILIIEV